MARKFTLTVFVLLLLFSNANSAGAGSIKIIRFWAEYDYGYALVDYINDTMETYQGGVTIQCAAVDSGNKEIGTNQRSLSSEIRPGFQTTMEIPVTLHGADLKSMRCTLIEKKD